MTRRYPPYHSQPHRSFDRDDQPRPRWWRPLTRWWGIVGVIIFIGLVLSLVDEVGRRIASKPESNRSASTAAATRAVQLDQSSPHPKATDSGVQRRKP
jgi:hypothetical protein